MNRYSRIEVKNKREIVLLKARPCAWGRCAFCDYIEDNSQDEDKVVKLNREVLKNVTGIYRVLEVIDSASVFELPKETLDEILRVVEERAIEKLFFEAHWIYRHRLDEIRHFFDRPIVFKTGVETFDNHFRQEVLKKGANFESWRDVKRYFDSPCIMVGIKGQTKDMIRRDIDILLNHFEYGTVSEYIENSTHFKTDEQLIAWFREEYGFLDGVFKLDILHHNTDFGVG